MKSRTGAWARPSRTTGALVRTLLAPTPWLVPRAPAPRARALLSEDVAPQKIEIVDVKAAAEAAAAALAACEFAGWDDRALWALEDSVPKFSIDGGRIVLWRRMSIEVTELLAFTPAELRARWLAKTVGTDVAARLRDEPPCLEDWVCTAPG